MSTNDQLELVNDDSDCEITAVIDSNPTFMDVPDYVDPNNLGALLNEPTEDLSPVVQRIVKNLTNDEEFERECDTFYKANLAIDVELVRVDFTKVLEEPSEDSAPIMKKPKLSSEIDNRTIKDLPDLCALCEESDNHVQLITNHFKNKHQLKNGLFICPFCDYSSTKYDSIMKHATKVHKVANKVKQCTVCNFATFRGDLYNRHMNLHHTRVYNCDHCNYKTDSLSNIKRHYTLKHTEESVQKSGNSQLNQVPPKKPIIVQSPVNKVLNCLRCPFKTTSLKALKEHEEIHNRTQVKKDEKFTYICVHCNYKTKNIKLLQEHSLMKHPKDEILFCNFCEFSTTISTELTKHAATHMKSEPI